MTINSPAMLANLKITRVDGFGVRIPMIKKILMAGIELTHAESFVIRIETACGIVGWGETASAPIHGGASLAELMTSFNDEIKGYLVNQSAIELSKMTNLLYSKIKNGKSAIAAVDMALFDVVGRYLNVPVYLLLGGKLRDQVSPLWLIGNSTIQEDLGEIDKKIKDGYRFFKLKLGVKTLDQDIALTHAIRQQFTDSIQICADANMGMNLDQASQYVQAVKDANLAYLEQPLHKTDKAGYQKLIAVSPVPIGLDESVSQMSDMLMASQLGIHGVSLKTLKFGGISGVNATGHVCKALSLKINLAGKVVETSIATAALFQLGASLPNVDWGVSPSHLYLEEDIVDVPQRPMDGFFMISDLPGLGIEVNESTLQRYSV